MEENILLAAFVILPILTGLLINLYFKKISSHLKKIQWLRLIIGNILVFVFLCSLVLLCGELYYRFLYDTTDSFGLTKVSLDWQERHYQYNNYKVRDSMNYALKRFGKRRITFIGDSFTAGHGIADVEDRFANLIRSMRPEMEIHVLADNGWDTYLELSTLVKLSQDGYEFEHVVLVYVLNDIADLMEEWREILKRIYFIEPGFFFEHSYFLNILYYHHFAVHDPDISDYYSFVHTAYDGPLWEKHKERLTAIKKGMDARGVKFSVVTFPFMHSLGPNYEYREIHERLGVFWKSLGAAHLDLLSVYESHRAKELVVNKYDAHPNELAHKMAAEAINEFLNKHMLNR